MQKQRKELNFEGQNIYVGIDVHLKVWSVTIMSEELELKTFTQPAKVQLLYDYLVRNYPNATYYSAYEAGFSGLWLHHELEKLKVKSIVVNAADIPTTQKEQVLKTDKRDSRKIARSLRSGLLKGIYIPSRQTQEDRTLVRTRKSIVRNLTSLRLQIKSKLYLYGIPFPDTFEDSKKHWSKAFMSWLREVRLEHESGNLAFSLALSQAEEQRKILLTANRQLRKMEASEPYKANMELLRTVPGVGLITGLTLLTEIEDIHRFSSTDKFAAYVGLIPSCHSSGEKEVNGEMTCRAHSALRSALVESAWTAVRTDPVLTLKYHKLCKRMEANKAICCIARKLLNRIYFVLKNKQEYVCAVLE
jgi:transposase